MRLEYNCVTKVYVTCNCHFLDLVPVTKNVGTFLKKKNYCNNFSYKTIKVELIFLV